MATAQARIYKTTTPAGWSWTFDITSTPDAAIKPLISGMPGILSSVTLNISTFE